MIQCRVGNFSIPVISDLIAPEVRCTYPVQNELAVGARPKQCKNTGSTPAILPYYDDNNPLEPRYVLQIVCIAHAAVSAVWKYLRNRPIAPLNRDEWKFLQEHCGLQGPWRTAY